MFKLGYIDPNKNSKIRRKQGLSSQIRAVICEHCIKTKPKNCQMLWHDKSKLSYSSYNTSSNCPCVTSINNQLR